jgi:hypothetical protein
VGVCEKTRLLRRVQRGYQGRTAKERRFLTLLRWLRLCFGLSRGLTGGSTKPTFPLTSMSSTVQAASLTSSTSNILLVTDALADYAKKTGIEISKNTFATAIDRQILLGQSQNYSKNERRDSRTIGNEIGH